MSAEPIQLAIPCDSAYALPAAVAAASAVRGTSAAVDVHFLSLDLGDERRGDMERAVVALAPAGRVKVSFVTLDGARLRRLGEWHGSPVAFSRLYLPELIPDAEWAISADADLFFRGDIAALWALRDGNLAVLGSRDHPLPPSAWNEAHIGWYREHSLEFPHPERYFCDGLSLMNLARLRADGFTVMAEEMATRHPDLPSPDQMIVNYLLQGISGLLPEEWGAFSGDENSGIDWSAPGCVHFVEDAPWLRRKATHLVSDLVLEWWALADRVAAVSPGLAGARSAWRGAANPLDFAWRRALFLALRANPWMLRIHPAIALHFRSTRSGFRFDAAK